MAHVLAAQSYSDTSGVAKQDQPDPTDPTFIAAVTNEDDRSFDSITRISSNPTVGDWSRNSHDFTEEWLAEVLKGYSSELASLPGQ